MKEKFQFGKIKQVLDSGLSKFKKAPLGVSKVFKTGIDKMKNIPFKTIWSKTQGIWNKTQGMTRSGLCKIGKHPSVEYQNVEGKPLCYKRGTCNNCKQTLEKITHEFEEYQSEGQCREARYCKHCHQVKQVRITHKYTKTYIGEKCSVIGVCEVCGNEKQLGEEQHHWRIIEEIDENGKSKTKQECLKCGKSKGGILNF